MTVNDVKHLYMNEIKNFFAEKVQGLPLVLTEEKTHYALVSNKFILYANKVKSMSGIGEMDESELDELELGLEITFTVGTEPRVTAEIMRILMCIVRPYDVKIAEEFFYDYENMQLYSGQDAYNKKYEQIQKEQGKTLCPVCDRWVLEKYMDKETEVCKLCKPHLNELIFH